MCAIGEKRGVIANYSHAFAGEQIEVLFEKNLGANSHALPAGRGANNTEQAAEYDTISDRGWEQRKSLTHRGI